MRRSERVVDITVGIGGQAFGKLFLARLQRFFCSGFLLVGRILRQSARFALFLGVETEVFEQQHLSGFQRSGLLGSFFAHAVAGEIDFHAQTGFDSRDDVLQRELVFRAFFRTSQVRHQNGGTAFGQHLLDGGDRRTDAGIVGNFEFFVQGHVEVHADNRALALEIVAVDRLHNTKNY